MAKVPLTSSVLVSADYDPLTERLSLEFQSGKVYTYAGVPMAHYQGLLLAKSAGKYYGAHIRNQYKAPDEEALF